MPDPLDFTGKVALVTHNEVGGKGAGPGLPRPAICTSVSRADDRCPPRPVNHGTRAAAGATNG